MREWPVPPFPSSLLKGTLPDSYADMVTPWQNYLIYLGLVLVLPLIYGFILFVLTCCGCCVRCGVHICPGPCQKLRAKNMSMLKIRIFSLIPYSLGYAFILVLTALGIAFFLWFLIGEISVRGETVTVGKRVVVLPDSVVSSTKDIVDVVPTIMSNFVSLIDDVTSFTDEMNLIRKLINDTKSSITGLTGHLDANAAAFKKVKDRQLSMAARTNGSSNPMSTIDFTAFDGIFTSANETIASGVNSGFDAIEGALDTGLSGVTTAVDTIKTSITTMNSTVASTLGNMVGQVETFMTQGKQFYEQYVSPDTFDTYEGYIKIVEAVFGVVVILVITLVVALMTCGFLCVFLRLWPCLKCLDCCASICIIAYAIVGTVSLVLWCLTEDICTQGEEYIGKVETSLDLPTFAIPTPTGKNITISFSAAFLGVLNCPEDSNFLDSSGLSIDSFDIPGFIKSYEDKFKENLQNFQISDLLSNALGNSTSITDKINVADDIGTQVNTLKSQITNVVSTFFSSYPLYLTFSDFSYETSQFAELNTLLAAHGFGPYGQSNVSKLAPDYYDTATQTPGQIVAGKGADFDTVNAGGLTADEKNRVWGNLARLSPSTVVAPGAIANSLVYNLTRMNAKSPIFAHETFDDYELLLVELDALVQSVNQTELFTKSVFNLKPQMQEISTQFNSTYSNTLGSITTFIYDAVDTVITRVTGVDILKCGFIGNYYRTVKTSYCGNLKTALGGTAVVALVMVLALFLMFFIIMFADCLACRKAGSRGKGYDSDDDSSISSIRK
eukprot:CAMPEP_0117445550 /NCGR_PEP_ID=MMETSP0759-20121206/5856_1 /TAXON_ID=63605 /ORGANISM="Percolomonas cosmopolitus, Strain WS" /LENGTH=781 /DNA_ID=CAMNT_0005237735 /DNA_START=198 /DNA_END=2543 /DNA_ORIENTATION=+